MRIEIKRLALSARRPGALAAFAWVWLLAALWVPSAPAANFLWEVVSLTNHAYLYGTVHAGKSAWYPLDRAVEDAFADAQVLVVEADITDREAMAKAAAAGTYRAPDALKNHVVADDYARFLKLLPRYGIPMAQVAAMRPFMAVSLLVFSEWARLGYLPQYGVDGYLIAQAKGEMKPVVEIEGVEAQIQLIEALTEQENRTIFAGTLSALESDLSDEQITGMVNAWQSGDPRLMLEIARSYNERVAGAREFEEKFVWSRHEAMLTKIEGYLNASTKRHFIAVGSLHLAGPRGLVEQLRRRGYLVQQR